MGWPPSCRRSSTPPLHGNRGCFLLLATVIFLLARPGCPCFQTLKQRVLLGTILTEAFAAWRNPIRQTGGIPELLGDKTDSTFNLLPISTQKAQSDDDFRATTSMRRHEKDVYGRIRVRARTLAVPLGDSKISALATAYGKACTKLGSTE